jgi:hypothetical protein
MLPCVPANFHSVARSLYIMSVAPAGNNSQNGFASVLTRLDWLLANLPTQLPRKDGAESRYQAFLSFGLDPDILEKTGDEVATLGEQLEGVFGWKTRTSGDGVIPILERGNAIRKLHPILKQYHEKYPNNNVLKKWIHDVIKGAEKVYNTHNVPVCSMY